LLCTIGLVALPALFKTRFDEEAMYQEQVSFSNFAIGKKDVVIRWQHVTDVDGVFGLFPPHVLFVKGGEMEGGEEQTMMLYRGAPNMDDLYEIMHRQVDPAVISDEVKKNVEVFQGPKAPSA
jgi:hypothetical protein